MNDLLALYRAQFKTTIAGQLQYRGALVIWLLGLVLEPTIYLIVWSTVARSQGGEVDNFTPAAFAAYFLTVMLVDHATFTWIMWEFEYRVRQGHLSPLLLRPVHPVHRDIADNATYKLLTLPVVLAVAALLAFAFRPAFALVPWALVAFVPVLAMAFAVRFGLEWTLAMTGFWTTRVTALNQLYYVAFLFLSGQAVPLALLPEPVRLATNLLPFRWFLGFPIELVLGRLSPLQALAGFGAQAAWLVVIVAALALVWRRGVRQYSAVGA